MPAESAFAWNALKKKPNSGRMIILTGSHQDLEQWGGRWWWRCWGWSSWYIYHTDAIFTAGEEHSAAAVIVKERTFANSNQCTFPIFNAYPLAVFQFVWPGFNDIAGGVVWCILVLMTRVGAGEGEEIYISHFSHTIYRAPMVSKEIFRWVLRFTWLWHPSLDYIFSKHIFIELKKRNHLSHFFTVIIFRSTRTPLKTHLMDLQPIYVLKGLFTLWKIGGFTGSK